MGRGVGEVLAMKAVILHGSIGHPFENWFPWLGKKLTEEIGWQVRVPQLPTPEGQNRDNWLHELEEQVGSFIDKNTVIIGHSGGALLLLNYLHETKQPIRGSVFTSTPFGKSKIPEFADLDKTFLNIDFNWSKIKKNAGHVVFFHGDDDPFSPLLHAERLAEKLNVEVNIVKAGGHLNSKAGYDKFPTIYNYIEEVFHI